MENIHKIIIVCLVAVILALGVAIGFTLMKEPVKTTCIGGGNWIHPDERACKDSRAI